jgi:hypothetical protein
MSRTLRKQVSIFLDLPDWKAMRAEAARQQIPITELCRRWMNPQMELLRENLCGPQGHRQQESARNPRPA